jgi:hypothetical protein
LAFSVLALTPPLQEAVLARLSGSRDEFERPS